MAEKQEAVRQGQQAPVKAPEKGTADAAGKPKKKKKVSGKAIFAIIIVLLIAGAGVSYYFNLLGVKDKVVGFFISQDQTYQNTLTQYNEQTQAYEAKQSELDTKQQQLDKKEQELTTREQALAQQESTATGGATAAGSTKNASAVAPMFEGMDAGAAAAIFNSTASDTWIAQVLAQMDQKKAAAILAQMDSAKASEVAKYIS